MDNSIIPNLCSLSVTEQAAQHLLFLLHLELALCKGTKQEFKKGHFANKYTSHFVQHMKNTKKIAQYSY